MKRKTRKFTHIFLTYRLESGECVRGRVLAPVNPLFGMREIDVPDGDVSLYIVARRRFAINKQGEVYADEITGHSVYAVGEDLTAYYFGNIFDRVKTADDVREALPDRDKPKLVFTIAGIKARLEATEHLCSTLKTREFVSSIVEGRRVKPQTIGVEKMARPKKNPEEVSTPKTEAPAAEKPKGRGKGKTEQAAAPSEAEKSATGFAVFEAAGEELNARLAEMKGCLSVFDNKMRDVFKEAGRMSKELDKLAAKANAAPEVDVKALQKELADATKAAEKAEAALAKAAEGEAARLEKAVAAALKAERAAVLAALKEETDAVKADAELEKPWKKYILELYAETTGKVKALPFPGA